MAAIAAHNQCNAVHPAAAAAAAAICLLAAPSPIPHVASAAANCHDHVGEGLDVCCGGFVIKIKIIEIKHN